MPQIQCPTGGQSVLVTLTGGGPAGTICAHGTSSEAIDNRRTGIKICVKVFTGAVLWVTVAEVTRLSVS